MENESTKTEVLDAVHALTEVMQGLASHMDARFDAFEQRMTTKEDLRKSDADIRDFVERRIAASEDRVIVEVRKVDTKVGTLTDIFERKSVITSDEADIVTA